MVKHFHDFASTQHSKKYVSSSPDLVRQVDISEEISIKLLENEHDFEKAKSALMDSSLSLREILPLISRNQKLVKFLIEEKKREIINKSDLLFCVSKIKNDEKFAFELITQYDKMVDGEFLSELLNFFSNEENLYTLLVRYGQQANDRESILKCMKNLKDYPELLGDFIYEKDRLISRLYLTLPIAAIISLNIENKAIILEMLSGRMEELTVDFLYNIENVGSIYNMHEIIPRFLQDEILHLIRHDPERSFANAQKPSQSLDILIAQNSLPDSLKIKDLDVVTYPMAKAGKILKLDPSASKRFRTGIIECDYSKSLAQEYHKPVFDDEGFIPALIDAEACRMAVDDSSYYQFTQLIKAGVPVRLISGGCDDEFLGITKDNPNLVIQRADDGFFYATTNQDCEIEYVIRSPSNLSTQNAYAEIITEFPENDFEKMKSIIEHYKDPAYGYKKVADSRSLPIFNDYKTWLDDLFQTRSGSCIHRVAAVTAKFAEFGVDKNNYRVSDIDNNHVIIEIKIPTKDGDKWHQVDLGGSNRVKFTHSSKTYESVDTFVIKDKTESLAQILSISSTKISDQKELESLANYASETSVLHGAGAAASADYSIKKIPKKSLIKTKDIEEHANFLITIAKKARRLVFYIDSLAKINLDKKTVDIREDETVGFEIGGELRKFLDYCDINEDMDPPPLLIINWAAFDARQRLTLNTILTPVALNKNLLHSINYCPLFCFVA